MKKLNSMYFSPTGTTKRVVEAVSNKILNFASMQKGYTIDFTLPNQRENGQEFGKEDILLIAVPVYAGRVPNVLLEYLNTVKGDNTLAIAMVVYGNREYDDALIELSDILTGNGFRVIAAASFIGEHSFSKTLAKDRPDDRDLNIARGFGDSIYKKIVNESYNEIKIKGNRPYGKYYIPRDEDGNPVDIRKVKPKTDEHCINCKICSQVCPMGSIDYEDVSKLNGICIKCGACVKRCPMSSKYFDDLDYLRHKHELEVEFKKRREAELFI